MLLYAITDEKLLNGKPFLKQIEDALIGGATFLQLREKDAESGELIEKARKIKKIAARHGVPFVVNDDAAAALKAGADGVHIGQNDMEYSKARSLLGSEKIVGMTAHSLKEALAAQKAGADYIGVGAVFSTATKKDASPISLHELKKITENVRIPVVAIGGINPDNILSLKGTGIDGVAAISAIFTENDAKRAAERMRRLSMEVVKWKA